MADPFNPFLPGQASDQLTAYTRSQAAAQQAAASLGARRRRYQRWCSSETWAPFQGLSGADLNYNSRRVITYNRRVTGLRTVHSGTYKTGTIEINNPAPITVSTGFEFPSGTLAGQFRWGGALTGTIVPGFALVSDLLPVQVPASDAPASMFTKDFFATAGALGVGILNGNGFLTGETYSHGAGQTDQSANVGFAGGTAFEYAPGILGLITDTDDDWTSVCIWGTSIAWGQNDSSGVGGFMCRALRTQGIPWVNMSRQGSQFANMVGYNPVGYSTLPYAKHVYTDHGTNDSGFTLATIKANAIEFWARLAAARCIVHQGTVLPRTNAGNTAPAANFGPGSTMSQFRLWEYDGAPLTVSYYGAMTAAPIGAQGGAVRIGQPGHPVSYLQDDYAAVAAPDGSELWADVADTSDGTHPSPAGHTKIALTVPVGLYM